MKRASLVAKPVYDIKCAPTFLGKVVTAYFNTCLPFVIFFGKMICMVKLPNMIFPKLCLFMKGLEQNPILFLKAYLYFQQSCLNNKSF